MAAALKPRAKNVMHALASHMKPDELHCWPGQPLLMTETGCARNTLREGIKNLEAAGFLMRRRDEGGVTHYYGTFPELTGSATDRVSHEPTPGQPLTVTGSATDPELPRELPKEQPTLADGSAAGGKEIWELTGVGPYGEVWYCNAYYTLDVAERIAQRLRADGWRGDIHVSSGFHCHACGRSASNGVAV